MFRHISHHLQGELTCSLLKTTRLYTAISYSTVVASGHVIEQLVEALRYKPEGRGFDGVTGIFH